MSNFIDKSIPDTKYDVTTVNRRNGVGYMGPVVRVNARDENHAKQVAESLGHEVNTHFGPTKAGEVYKK